MMKLESVLAQSFDSAPASRVVGALASLLVLLPVSVQAQHDCGLYAPTDASQVVDGSWVELFKKHYYQFKVPADAGGGYVISRIETTEPSLPEMRIISPSGQGVVAQSAPAFPGPSPQVLEVAFEIDAGTRFDVEIGAALRTEDLPVPYQWSWSFVSRVDCYEPNDGRPGEWPDPVTDSKTVPLDQVLEAYSLAGYQSYGIAAFDANNFDWYDFTLDAPTEIWLATVAVPVDQSIRVRLFDSTGLALVDKVPSVGTTVVIGPTLLQPGTYYLDLHPEIRGESSVTLSEGGSIPDHFERPYRFIVSTRQPDAILQDQ